MNESLYLAYDIVKIFAVIYGIIAFGVLVYGIISVFTGRTRVYKDEDSSYGFSDKLTVFNSAINRSFSPFYFHRRIPKESKSLSKEPAVIMGWNYIFIGLLMLLPLVWAYNSFR